MILGVGVTYSFKNTRTMIAGLESIQESSEGSGSAFFGILRACELIPYDSVIFICTDRVPSDVNMAQYAAITLLKKRIRVIFFCTFIIVNQSSSFLTDYSWTLFGLVHNSVMITKRSNRTAMVVFWVRLHYGPVVKLCPSPKRRLDRMEILD